MTKVEQFESIRHDRRVEKLSVRQLAQKYKVHRRTVRQALESATPPEPKAPERPAPSLDPYKAIIRQWLVEDKTVHAKQRHSARRIWQRLVDEHLATIGESTVRKYVAVVRAEIAGTVSDVPIVQDHQDGAEAEVDFGEFYADIAGVSTKVYLFAMRLSASGKAFHHAYVTCAQEAFFDGHVPGLRGLLWRAGAYSL